MWDWTIVVWDWLKDSWPYLLGSVAWLVLACGVFGGFVGVFLPLIPGALVVFLTALIHKWMLPDWLSWWSIGGLFVLVIVDRVVDFGGTALGAKWFGGGKWAIWGAIIGAVVGIFFGPFGLILGPVFGAIVFEYFGARSNAKLAMKSGVGAGVGFGISTLGRLVVFCVMMAVIGIDIAVDYEGELDGASLLVEDTP